MPVVIVTGASQGIGKAIALRLAEDGFDIALNDLAMQEESLQALSTQIGSIGRRVIIATGDVSIEQDVQRIIDDTVSRLGELNVMVANAGIMRMAGLLDLPVQEFDKVQAVNVRGVFLCYQKAAAQMIKQGKGGRIIGACSISGYRPQAMALAYGVSKWAVRGLTQASAMDLARYGITVNAYCPGIVKTPMWDEIDAAISGKMGVPPGFAFEKSVSERSAMGKPSTPEDVAGCVSFLVGKDAGMITGQSLIVDGGIQFS
ncbi:putative short chain oxidoreductase [Pleurostoma richardsiae]|uniref:Short chain oxidoreductase n=1 Tax=Pleurostoma richardsiae TaxID=41990 RepID=A0AA38REY6_9PEZI|nr:putative short chain oxidoreductase [Pleurostoma richardsiae]